MGASDRIVHGVLTPGGVKSSSWSRLGSLLVLGSVPFWCSCISVQMGTPFDLSSVNRLQVGKTTKAEASQLFGSPMLTIELATWQHPRVHFGDENTAVIWRYAKGSGSLVGVNARMLQLSFDAEGRLTDYHFESTYKRDAAQHPAKEVDFDIFAARQGIVVGQSSRADVASLMGTNYVVMPFNKPGIAMRWHYGFSKKTKTEPAGRADKRVEATCGKSLEVDFDERGIVRHLQGESDFPGDVARDRSTSSTAPTGRP